MRKPMQPAQNEALAMMREVLRDGFLTLSLPSYDLHEDAGAARCVLRFVLDEAPSGRRFEIASEGSGLIDAFFKGIVDRYAQEHPSLTSIRFTHFSVRGLIPDATSGNATDAKAEASITVANSARAGFDFGAVSHSVGHASIEAVLSAVEYFINSERAYVTMYQALQHYRSEGRADLVQKYERLLAEMVRNTSYSNVVARLQADRHD